MRVYERIQSYLAEHHFEASLVARKADIPTTVFQAMMVGKHKMYADDLKNICEALNVGAETFLDVKIS